MKKILTLFLLLAVLIPLTAGCKKEESSGKNEQTTNNSNVNSDSTGIAREDTPDGLPSDLDFGGADINIFYGSFDATFSNKLYELEGSMSGDDISAAVYERNESVAKRLNVNFSFYETKNVETTKAYRTEIENAINAGSNEYDIFYHRGATSLIQVNQGLFKNLDEFRYLDLEREWWFYDQMREISLNANKNYVLLGDLLLSNYSNMTAIFFNKSLYDEIYRGQGESLYDVVKNNEWTWDKYYKIVEDAYSDEDGNGFKNIGDHFGAIYETDSNRTGTYYPYTSGLTFSSRDDNGFPVLQINNERTISLIESMYKFIYENSGTIEMTMSDAQSNFINGKILFHAYFLTHGKTIQQNVTFEYGVLPFPKYDENVDYTTALLSGAGVYVMPVNLPEGKIDAVGAALEALCAENYRKVSLKYYDTILKTKQIGSDEDREMIDFIRNHLKFDLTFWVGGSIGNVTNIFKEIVIVKQSKDFSSYWRQNGSMYENALVDLIDSFKGE